MCRVPDLARPKEICPILACLKPENLKVNHSDDVSGTHYPPTHKPETNLHYPSPPKPKNLRLDHHYLYDEVNF